MSFFHSSSRLMNRCVIPGKCWLMLEICGIPAPSVPFISKAQVRSSRRRRHPPLFPWNPLTVRPRKQRALPNMCPGGLPGWLGRKWKKHCPSEIKSELGNVCKKLSKTGFTEDVPLPSLITEWCLNRTSSNERGLFFSLVSWFPIALFESQRINSEHSVYSISQSFLKYSRFLGTWNEMRPIHSRFRLGGF